MDLVNHQRILLRKGMIKLTKCNNILGCIRIRTSCFRETTKRNDDKIQQIVNIMSYQ